MPQVAAKDTLEERISERMPEFAGEQRAGPAAMLMAAGNESTLPNNEALWNQYKTKFLQVCNEVDEETVWFQEFQVERQEHSRHELAGPTSEVLETTPGAHL